jgi:hypothetical protein
VIFLDRDHLDRRIALRLVAEREGILRQEDRIVVEVAGNVAAAGRDELL